MEWRANVWKDHYTTLDVHRFGWLSTSKVPDVMQAVADAVGTNHRITVRKLIIDTTLATAELILSCVTFLLISS